MSRKFFSKGKGSARKIIPINGGWKKKRITVPMNTPGHEEYWKAVPGAVRIMKALENAETVILDREDLLEMDMEELLDMNTDVLGILPRGNKKIPELAAVKKQLKATTNALMDSVVPAINEITNSIRFSTMKKTGLGVEIQALEGQFWAALHDAFMAQETLEKVLKEIGDGHTIPTYERHLLESVSANISDATSEMEAAIKGIKRAYIVTRKEDYRRIKEFRNRQQHLNPISLKQEYDLSKIDGLRGEIRDYKNC